jgi:hypothetical protein
MGKGKMFQGKRREGLLFEAKMIRNSIFGAHPGKRRKPIEAEKVS